MTLVSVCLSSDSLSTYYLTGVSLTLDVGYLLLATHRPRTMHSYSQISLLLSYLEPSRLWNFCPIEGLSCTPNAEIIIVLEAVPLSGYLVVVGHGAEPLFVVQKVTAIRPVWGRLQSLPAAGGDTAWLVPGAPGDGDAGWITGGPGRMVLLGAGLRGWWGPALSRWLHWTCSWAVPVASHSHPWLPLLRALKILPARLQQYVNRQLPDVQAGFRKGKGTREQIANICCIIKKQESSRKTSTSALLTMPKPLIVWITINCGQFWKRWEYQTTWPACWETCMQVRKQQLELDMEQQTGSI